MIADGLGGMQRPQLRVMRTVMSISHWKKNKRTLGILEEVEVDVAGEEVDQAEGKVGRTPERF